MSSSVYDILIIGGGIVGASLACALQPLGVRIALIDATPYGSEDPRSFALHAGSTALLQTIGIWECVASLACPIKQVHVSSQGKFGAVRLQAEEMHIPALGHVIPAHTINHAFDQRLPQLSHLTVYKPAILKSLHHTNNKAYALIELPEGEKTLHASTVFAADGSHSAVRRLLHIESRTFDYQQSAIVTLSSLARAHQHIAYERFAANETIAMLPLNEHQYATIWAGPQSRINLLLNMNNFDFAEALQKQFGYRLGRLETTHPRHTFPLIELHAVKMHQPPIFLLGNALHTLHPVAAQGLNLALYEVSCIAKALKEGLELHTTFPKIHQQQIKSMRLTHGLATWMGKDSALLSAFRQTAMLGMDLCIPAKRMFLKQIIWRCSI